MISKFAKTRSALTAVTLLVATASYALMPTSAFADTNDFVPASNGGLSISAPSAGKYVAGQEVTITLHVSETTVDQGGGENHPHAVPPTVSFTFTPSSSGSVVTETGTILSGGTYETDKLDQSYSGTYQVALPNHAGTFQVNTNGVTMFQPKTNTSLGTQVSKTNGFSDSDDPVDGFGSIPITTTSTNPGTLPEVPYAGLLPLVFLGGYIVYRTSKKNRVIH